MSLARQIHVGWISFSLLLFANTFHGPACADAMRTVALTGQQASGTQIGAIFQSFNAAVVNNSGRAAFSGRLLIGPGEVVDVNQGGVWSEGTGLLQLVAREGTAAPGTSDGATFRDFSFPDYQTNLILNESGEVSFDAYLRSASGLSGLANGAGIWSEADSVLELSARQQDQAAGVPAGALYSRLGFDNSPRIRHVFNDQGEVAFVASLTNSPDGTGGVTSSNRNGLWSGYVDAPKLVARAGGQAPGTPVGAVFSSFESPVINSAGATVFAAGLLGASVGVNSTNNRGLWSNRNGDVELVARMGSPAPGLPRNNLGLLFSPSINNAGQIAFVGQIEPSLSPSEIPGGVWADTTGELGLVAATGMQAPGAAQGINYQSFSRALINGQGDVAFDAYLQVYDGFYPPSGADQGIWVRHDEEIRLVARRGVLVPDPNLPPELAQGSVVPGTAHDTKFEFFNEIVLNKSGRVAFSARVRSNSTQSTGLWAEDSRGILKLIAMEGDQVDVDIGLGVELRTINVLKFEGDSGNEDGRPSGFNDSGQVSFTARFTDGTWGVLISSLVSDTSVLGDYDFNGTAGFEDFMLWKNSYCSASYLAADGNGNGIVDAADYTIWRNAFDLSAAGAGGRGSLVPEPSSWQFAAICGLLATFGMRRRLS